MEIISNEKKNNENSFYFKLETFGQRLSFVRRSFGLTRNEIARVTQTNEAHLRLFERSIRPYVNTDIVRDLYNNFDCFNKYVDPNWLIYGVGEPPNFLREFNYKNIKEPIFNIECVDDEKNILIELIYWKNQFKNSITYKISDNYFVPKLSKNDYLGGILVKNENIHLLKNIDVLIFDQFNSVLNPYYLNVAKDNEIILSQQLSSENNANTISIDLNNIDKLFRIAFYRKVNYSEISK